MTFQIANQYVQKGRLHCSALGDLSLFCYTKEEFFNKDDWDDVTLTHRGKLYYRGEEVNRPFPKIFNLGEHPSASEDKINELLNSEPYYVLDKSNGHLFFVSAFYDENGELQLAYHTKGCITPDNLDMLEKDIARFREKHELYLRRYMLQNPDLLNITMMCESIADYDKHTMYEQQVAMYGEGFVLLGMYSNWDGEWKSDSHNWMKQFGKKLEMSVVKHYKMLINAEDMADMFNHKDIEGYVIWFPRIDFRFKIKTKEYWALRMKKDLTLENILAIFSAGGVHRLQMRLPEEIVDAVIEKLRLYMWIWYASKMATEFNDAENVRRLMALTDKELFTSDISHEQKICIKEMRVKKTIDRERLMKSSSLREEFSKALLNDSKEFGDELRNSLGRIVETIGVKGE